MSKTITSAEYNAWLEHPLTKGLKRSFQQSITDPENQPSQYGTVTLEMYEALEDQLAAAQLNNKLLRKALEFLNARIVTMDLGGVVERALSLPASTEALDAYVAEKVKEAGKFDMWKTNPYTKVLETSIEQLTKQRDLAVEALEKIAAPVRADGTYNRCREACEILARETLSAIKKSEGK